MIIGNSGLEQLVSHAVGAIGRKTLTEVSQDTFGAVAAAGLTNGAFPVSSQTTNAASPDDSQSKGGYNESFARMMVNLKSAADTSLSEKTADRDNGVIGSAANTGASGGAATGSVQQFMDTLKQTAEEKVREKLTGINQQQYTAMTPEDQLTIDQKVQDALKDKQNDVADDINTRIRGIKAGLLA
ncbi:hypothetical protein G7013_21625 [Pseudomonas viridiflava]|uniref:Uncharacterized protein n=1 Tax=Pseudomonas viridiflava TaxID=33069 RepID=A0A3M5P207_PSEVI|nr:MULTISPECIES: hypothetical protein [Pseudomonas syringae group]MBA1232252.1 hypothetical protein [Pseudomonas viridiflava]MCF5710208.1 hypothetical protein [Pseudomonas syringae]RMT78551.1 hypothetical protein ALP40_02046 [Pseudomonas viridiflava]